MTALIRGFDQSLRDIDQRDRPEQRSSFRSSASRSFANGAEFIKLLKRPEPDASPTSRAIEAAAAPTLGYVDAWNSGAGGPSTQQRVSYRDLGRPRPLVRPRRARSTFADGTRIPILRRPLLQRHRACSIGATSSCSATRRLQAAASSRRRRSDRQARPRRHRAVRGRRRVRQAAVRRAASASARTTSSSIPHDRIPDASTGVRASARISAAATTARTS